MRCIVAQGCDAHFAPRAQAKVARAKRGPVAAHEGDYSRSSASSNPMGGVSTTLTTELAARRALMARASS
jgi:hypothetical protein